MHRLLLAIPLLASCVHQPDDNVFFNSIPGGLTIVGSGGAAADGGNGAVLSVFSEGDIRAGVNPPPLPPTLPAVPVTGTFQPGGALPPGGLTVATGGTCCSTG